MIYWIRSAKSDLYPYVKQHESKRDDRGAFNAINSRWIGPNHVNMTASAEAEAALQMLMYNGEKKARNWESMYPDMSSTISSLRT